MEILKVGDVLKINGWTVEIKRVDMGNGVSVESIYSDITGYFTNTELRSYGIKV